MRQIVPGFLVHHLFSVYFFSELLAKRLLAKRFMVGDLVMGEATKGEGFSSSLVYALIKISACGTIVRVNPEKISTGGDKFLYYNLMHAQSVCTRLSSLSPRPALSGEPGFEAIYLLALVSQATPF